MCADRYLGASSNGPSAITRGKLTDSAGAVLSPTITGAGTFLTPWLPRSELSRVMVQFYGSASAQVAVEESWDKGTTATNATVFSTQEKTLPTSGGSTKHVISASVRILAPLFRIVFVNGSAAQSGAVLYGAQGCDC